MSSVGLVYGETCNRDGCTGEMIRSDEVNCSCHISPPCSNCVEAEFECSKCGYHIDGPSSNQQDTESQIKKPAISYKRIPASELFSKLNHDEFGYVTIAGKYYWMEYRGRYPKSMQPHEILEKFNTCFGYTWIAYPENGEFHIKIYTD